MRKLKTSDLFAALRVVNKIGLKDELAKMSEVTKDGTVKFDAEKVGIEFIVDMLANAGTKESETAIYEFLAAPMEVTVEELKDRDLTVFVDSLKDCIELNKEVLKPFFKSLAALMKSN